MSTDGGVPQRWRLVYSDHRRPQAQRLGDKHWLKQRAAEEGLSAALPHRLCLCR
jgi:hypothetical protein